MENTHNKYVSNTDFRPDEVYNLYHE